MDSSDSYKYEDDIFDEYDFEYEYGYIDEDDEEFEDEINKCKIKVCKEENDMDVTDKYKIKVCKDENDMDVTDNFTGIDVLKNAMIKDEMDISGHSTQNHFDSISYKNDIDMTYSTYHHSTKDEFGKTINVTPKNCLSASIEDNRLKELLNWCEKSATFNISFYLLDDRYHTYYHVTNTTSKLYLVDITDPNKKNYWDDLSILSNNYYIVGETIFNDNIYKIIQINK